MVLLWLVFAGSSLRSAALCASHSSMASAALWLFVCWCSCARWLTCSVLACTSAATRQQRLAKARRCQQPVSSYVCCFWISGCVCLWLAALNPAVALVVCQQAAGVSCASLLALVACSYAKCVACRRSGCCHHMRTRSCWYAVHLSLAAVFAMFVCLVGFVRMHVAVYCYTGCTIRALV